jgi:WD40 repeat protein
VNWKDTTTHTSPLYSLAPLEHGCLSGDENGTVRLWDFRTDKCSMESKRFDEFVSCFYVPEGGQTVVASSGEGTIQARDMFD